MANYPNMNPMVMPPPPPPPPMAPMDPDQNVPMMPPMMEPYDEEMAKMVVPVDTFGPVGVPPMVPGFVPQPPSGPPPVPVVPGIPVPQPMMMAPPLAMVQNLNFQTGQMSRHLIDPYLAAEISSIVHTLSTSQLIYVLAALKKFLKHAPSEARRFLINNPQLTYALLHTQFILGEHDESVLPLSKLDYDISQLNKLERSMHLKPFHNLYEDQGGQEQPMPYSHEVAYHPQEMMAPPPRQMGPDRAFHEQKADERHYKQKPVQRPGEGHSPEAKQSDIDELMNQGIYPASAALVDEVIKNPEILTNIQKATRAEMNSWPAEQKEQVLSIKLALHMRGISVNL